MMDMIWKLVEYVKTFTYLRIVDSLVAAYLETSKNWLKIMSWSVRITPWRVWHIPHSCPRGSCWTRVWRVKWRVLIHRFRMVPVRCSAWNITSSSKNIDFYKISLIYLTLTVWVGNWTFITRYANVLIKDKKKKKDPSSRIHYFL